MTDARLFDAYYFQHGCGQPYHRTPAWLSAFAGLADRIVRDLQPRTALDAGCAMGFLVEALRDRGVQAYGVDVSKYALQQVRDDIRPYCWSGSIAEPLPQRYDLITCIEVLEHMSQAESERAIANLCQATDDILFSSTPFDYQEATHFNVQPPEYWAYHFALQGFVRDVDFDASFITQWAVRFRRTIEPWPRIVQDFERRFWLLWKENGDLRSLMMEMRDQLAAGEQRTKALQAEVARVTASRSWRVIQRLRSRLFPADSWRERWLTRILQAFQKG
jgi:SAM-dependent methyltransferase